jgi:hypothetical protein
MSFNCGGCNCPNNPEHVAWTAYGVTKIPKEYAKGLQDGGSNISFLRNTYIENPTLSMVSGASAASAGNSLSSLEFYYPKAMPNSSSSTNAMSLMPMTNRYQYGMINSLAENAGQKMQEACMHNKNSYECKHWSDVKSNMDHQLSMGKTKLFGQDLIPIPQSYQRNF